MAKSSSNINGIEIHHITFGSWSSLIPFLDGANNWVFRGQGVFPHPEIQTSLERAHKLLKENPLDIEKRTLREFKRRAKLTGAEDLPADPDIVEWLALLQHHGAPTRLLDCTRSVYVALFFAVEKATGDSEIWCFRSSALSQNLQPPWSGDKNAALQKLLEPKANGQLVNIPCAVFKDEPFYLNRRLALQQGCFLIPFDVSKTFLENLFSPDTGLQNGHDTNLGDANDYLKKLNYFRIIIPHNQHSQIRAQLRRMNMTREHLFPGLDGTAMSFWQEA